MPYRSPHHCGAPLSPTTMWTLRASLAALLTLWALPATAQVQVNVTASPEINTYGSLVNLNEQTLSAALTEEVNNLFFQIRPQTRLTDMANAQTFATHGLGADYTNSTRRFVFGVAANASISASGGLSKEVGFGDDQIFPGAAAAFSAMAGVNLTAFDGPPVTLYMDGSWGQYERRNFSVSGTTFGVRAQANLLAPRQDDDIVDLLFQWGGISLTGGVVYNHIGLTLEEGSPYETSIGQQPVNNVLISSAGVDLALTGDLDFNGDAFSIPLEVTTSFRFLYFFTFFGGVGLDVNLGSNRIEASLNGTMTSRITRQPGVSSAQVGIPDELYLGTVAISADESGGPSPVNLRGLFWPASQHLQTAGLHPIKRPRRRAGQHRRRCPPGLLAPIG